MDPFSCWPPPCRCKAHHHDNHPIIGSQSLPSRRHSPPGLPAPSGIAVWCVWHWQLLSKEGTSLSPGMKGIWYSSLATLALRATTFLRALHWSPFNWMLKPEPSTTPPSSPPPPPPPLASPFLRQPLCQPKLFCPLLKLSEPLEASPSSLEPKLQEFNFRKSRVFFLLVCSRLANSSPPQTQ